MAILEAPERAKERAVERPKPLEAPVINTEWDLWAAEERRGSMKG